MPTASLPEAGPFRRPALTRTALTISLALVAIGALARPLPARAAPVLPDVTVRVTILELRDLNDDLDNFSDADFYTVTTFDDGAGGIAEHTSATWDGEEVVEPNVEWTFAANPSKGSVKVGIDVFDDDDTFNGGDDRADVVSGDGSAVAIDVDLRPCAIRGNVMGSCGQQITAQDGDKIIFKVDVLLPDSTPGLRMQCLHDPIWPQPGDLVTITATALDGAAKPLPVADRVTIKLEGTDVPDRDRRGDDVVHLHRHRHRVLVRVRGRGRRWGAGRDHDPASGARGPENDRAVPIVYTGPSDRRIDVVLLADAGAYTGPANPKFLRTSRPRCSVATTVTSSP